MIRGCLRNIPGSRQDNGGKDCLQMNKIREKLQRFMIGRYGMDQLGQFIMYTVLVLIFLNVVGQGEDIVLIPVYPGAGRFFLLYFRMFSKNVGKRYQENQVYLRLRFYVTEYFRKIKFRFTEGRKYRIFKCPDCGQKVRIPRGHGKVSVHCPKCGTDFIKKS